MTHQPPNGHILHWQWLSSVANWRQVGVFSKALNVTQAWALWSIVHTTCHALPSLVKQALQISTVFQNPTYLRR